jgi:fructose-1,6-bisphosphatase II / sedoheptulose-1,7-bisphosphatase
MSTGGAPKGVLVDRCAALHGGQMQCRLELDTDEKRERAARMGVSDPRAIFAIEDMVRGSLFSATGVTDGAAGVQCRFSQAFH